MVVVRLRSRESSAELEDEFLDGEQHFRVPLHIVDAFTVGRDGTRRPLKPLPNRATAAFPNSPIQVPTRPPAGATNERPPRRDRRPAAGMER